MASSIALRQQTAFLAAPAAASRRSSRASASRSSLIVRASSAVVAPFRAVNGGNFDNPFTAELEATAQYIAKRGKGILASDESNATTGKRLASVGVENTEENRRAWRELLYTAPGLGNYISGAIMFDETLYQKTAQGVDFVKVLKDQGIVPGIKVDTGLEQLPGTDGETATQGLDGLGARCAAYYKQGARFAKWRAVLNVGGGRPSSMAVTENCHGLARYAQIAQANGLVPIVEPEVTLGPGDYTIEETAYASERVYSHVMRMLNEYNVNLNAILLKPNMILPGLDAKAASPAEVAKWTVRVLKKTLPPAVPGVHFLSGGMSEFESTVNLQALQDEEPNAPWSLTFSYGRALQSATLKTWAGEKGNVDAAQKILVALAKANSEAQLGKFKPETHPVPSKIGEGRILQALRLGGPGK